MFVTLAEGISQCEQLADAVRRGPLAVDLAFPYHPHVTIAHHLDDPTLDRAFEELAGVRVRLRRSTDFHLYVHDEEVGWQPDTSSSRCSRGGDLTSWPRSRSGSPPGSRSCARGVPSSTTWSGWSQHYGDVKGGLQAGAVTYFAFLSFFPILALAFFVVGLLSQVYPDARGRPRRGDRTACCPG